MTTVAERAVGAVVGGLVADAAARPIHKVYGFHIRIDDILKNYDQPEFIPKNQCRQYNIPTGKNSCYGDQAYALLQSLVACKGFDKADYKQRLYEAMGPDSAYEGNLGRPVRAEDWPISFPWRNDNIIKFIENFEAGKEDAGDNQPMADGFAQIAAIAALYAGRPELESVVREAVSVTQSNEVAIEAAIAGAKIIEQYILKGPSDDVLTIVANGLQGKLAKHMAEAMNAADMEHKPMVMKFGNSAGLPGPFKGAVHCLAKSDGDYVNTVRMDMTATGDNCCRLNLVGAAMGAQVGISNIPADWISRTDLGANTKELAEKLVALRPS